MGFVNRAMDTFTRFLPLSNSREIVAELDGLRSMEATMQDEFVDMSQLHFIYTKFFVVSNFLALFLYIFGRSFLGCTLDTRYVGLVSRNPCRQQHTILFLALF